VAARRVGIMTTGLGVRAGEPALDEGPGGASAVGMESFLGGGCGRVTIASAAPAAQSARRDRCGARRIGRGFFAGSAAFNRIPGLDRRGGTRYIPAPP